MVELNVKKINEIKARHLDSFNWKGKSSIPLGIWVNDKSKHKNITFGASDFHKRLFERQVTMLEDTISIGSDIVPVLGIKNYAVSIVPSIFGAKLISPGVDIDRIEDAGYWVEKLLVDIEDVEKLDSSKMQSELFLDLMKQLEYYKRNSPSWAEIAVMVIGPFSIAELLRGSDIYLDMYDNPEYVHRLLQICTDTLIRCVELFRETLGYSNNVKEACTPFGMWYPGLRFGDDSIINLSPELIKEFVIPYYDKIARAFNCSIEVHFCTMPASLGEQILDGLLDSQNIKGISTQLGTLHYEKNLMKIKNKLSVEAAYGHGLSYFSEKYGNFKNWASYIKMHFSNTSGLVLYTEVSSVEEGKRMLDEWLST